MKDINIKSANNIRALSVAMVEEANSGHPGGSMGGADFSHILFSEFLRFDPNNPEWFWRDRFFLDPGHLSAMLYAQLYLLGNFDKKDIANFRKWGSCTPGHPELDLKRGVENTSGPLGQGHAMAVGAALAGKFFEAKFGEWTKHNIYTYISDGGIQEEISQGVGRIAGYLGLDNLIMFFDSNEVQLSTYTKEVTQEDTAAKYKAWGWNVLEIDGHNYDSIRKALTRANDVSNQPTLIIGKTIIGKGCVDENGRKYEGYPELHGSPLSSTGADYKKTLRNLGAYPDKPFEIYSEVAEYYQNIIDKKSQEFEAHQKNEAEWRFNNPKLAKKLDLFMSGELPEIDFGKIKQKNDIATRAASAQILGFLADHLENLIVASADLANSDKTDGYLKKVRAFKPNHFDANFIHAGVSEFSMAAIANGMALHGGVIPVIGTFFIFSDYQKPAIRLSSLMELPVIYLWTHDSFRVGEDGPTHQPIEQEAQIRLMEKLKNHSGINSFLALRPSDANETTVAWEMALKEKRRPIGLILSRQTIKDLPSKDERYLEAQEARKGAYLVTQDPDARITLLASGSEVATLVEVSEILLEDNIKCNIVSVISEGLFREQSKEYQRTILGDLPIIGLTAGLPFTLNELIVNNGMVIGLEHFGYSAAANILNEKLGFTGKQIYEQVNSILK